MHGIAHDTIEFVQGIITTEMNSATDNPIVFAERGETVSAGNFHGEYPAKALDYLAIGVHELASMSERRVARLCNPAYSELPAFLVTLRLFNTWTIELVPGEGGGSQLRLYDRSLHRGRSGLREQDAVSPG